MADKSAIEWTDATWTPIRARVWEIQNDGSGKERIGWHCEHASEGCRFCYAEGFNRRLGTGRDFKPGELYREKKRGYNNGEVKLFLDQEMLTAPLRWKKPRMVFVCSMTDLFADFVPDEWIDKVFAVMALAPQHTFQVLTKRAKRMREYLTDERVVLAVYNQMRRLVDQGVPTVMESCLRHDIPWRKPQSAADWWPLRNAWLGVSAERQQEADERIPELLATPAAIRFVSAEPLLGPIDFGAFGMAVHHGPKNDRSNPHVQEMVRKGREYFASEFGTGIIDWIIVGGESGPNARPMHPDWARSIRDQCTAAGVPFFFKQWGAWTQVYDRQVEDPDWRRCDDVARETPHGRWLNEDGGQGFHGGRVLRMDRVGKKAAGRLLDGVEHNGMPEMREVPAL